MIVSTPMVVLPVWRSPMISSRWPRPIGIIESIALMPVCSGSTTGWRWTTPGALNSAGRVSEYSISPLPSSGLPSGSTMRPSRPSPTGISSSVPVRLTVSPSTILSQSPNSTAPTLSDSRFRARPVTSCGNSRRSKAMQFSRPWMRAMPSPIDRTVPTSVSSAWPESRPSMRLLRMEVISSGLICMVIRVRFSYWGSGGLRHLAAKLVKSVADGGVEDGVADAQDDASEHVRVDGGRELDLAAGLVADRLGDAVDRRAVELDGRGDRHRQQLVLVGPQVVELAADAEDRRHAVLLDEELEEVLHRRVSTFEQLAQGVLLLLGREVRREEEHLQLAGLVERV